MSARINPPEEGLKLMARHDGSDLARAVRRALGDLDPGRRKEPMQGELF